jgi:CPA2 family monovalent cation:H+ antiporter-2
VTDEVGDESDRQQPRLHSVVLAPGVAAVGRTLRELDLSRMRVEVTALRRRNLRSSTPERDARLDEGDVLVLRGKPQDLAEAEIYLLGGKR